MPRTIDITGQRFGKLVVLGRAPPSPSRHSFVRCRCDCGNEKTIAKSHLKAGLIQSCGCFRSDTAIFNIVDRETKYLHKDRDMRTYRTWNGMIGRCYRDKSKSWKNYGARGIRVCDRWRIGENGKHPYQYFVEDMGIRPPEKTLDRKDPDGDYCPSNCRWATLQEQESNKRKIVRVPLREFALLHTLLINTDPDQPWLG